MKGPLLALSCAALLGGACAAFSACGSCGEPEPDTSSGPGTSTVGTGSGGSGGSGEVAMSPRKENSGQPPEPEATPSRVDSAQPGQSKAPAGQLRETHADAAGKAAAPIARRSRLISVSRAELPAALRGTRAGRLAFVFETDGCRDCALVEPVLSSLVDSNSALYDFYRVDVAGVRLTTSTKMPVTLMYSGSERTSALSGPPFAREPGVDGKGESDLAYAKRLRHWFQDALTQQSLNLRRR